MSDNSMVIRNATIVDGTGGDPFEGDVFIKDGIIQEVGNISNDCDKQIDAKGLILSRVYRYPYAFRSTVMLGWLCNSFN